MAYVELVDRPVAVAEADVVEVQDEAAE